jgi:ribonuclease P protein component
MEKIVPIRENKDFVTLYKKGKSYLTPYYVVYLKKNRQKIKRLGITTGKKVGNSVARSRCRRIIRVIYRDNYEMFPIGYDAVIVARSGLDKQNARILSDNFAKDAKSFFEKNYSHSDSNKFRKDNKHINAQKK